MPAHIRETILVDLGMSGVVRLTHLDGDHMVSFESLTAQLMPGNRISFMQVEAMRDACDAILARRKAPVPHALA